MIRRKNIRALWIAGFAVSVLIGGSPAREGLAAPPPSSANAKVTANVVVIDQPLMFNRLGAANVNGMIYALRRDVINSDSRLPLTAGGAEDPGNIELRPDRRPRPLVLRVREGDCLTVNLKNLLTSVANPFLIPSPGRLFLQPESRRSARGPVRRLPRRRDATGGRHRRRRQHGGAEPPGPARQPRGVHMPAAAWPGSARPAPTNCTPRRKGSSRSPAKAWWSVRTAARDTSRTACSAS